MFPTLKPAAGAIHSRTFTDGKDWQLLFHTLRLPINFLVRIARGSALWSIMAKRHRRAEAHHCIAVEPRHENTNGTSSL